MSEARITLSSSSNEYTTLNEIFDSDRVHNGDVITLHTDVTIGQTVTIANAKRCTIDLNGHFIFIPIVAGILVKGAASATFINGKIQTLSPDQIEDSLIVQGSKTQMILGEGLEVSSFGTAVHVRKRGQLIIDGARVSSTGTQPTIYVDDAYSTMIMNDGYIASYEKSAIAVRNEGSATINGGEIHTESNGLVPENVYPAVLVYGKDSKLEHHGGVIVSSRTPAAKVEAAGHLEVTGGTLYSTSKEYPALEMQNGYSSFKMTDGWLYSTQYCAILSNMMDYMDVQDIQVTGGKVGAEGDIIYIAGSGDHGILFSGGKVKGNLPQDYIAAGYVVSDIKDDDGYASIILKTWVEPEDVRPLFPDAGLDPDVKQNPFDVVPDPDMFQPNPFDEIGYVNTLPDDHDNMDSMPPMPEQDVYSEDPFAPSPLPGQFEIPVPVPDMPDPGSNPEPEPEPEPEPQPDPRIINTSVNIRRNINIYRTPSRSKVITEWRGALLVWELGYYSPIGEEYALVKFRIPGSGKGTSGYATVEDLIREGGLIIDAG